METILQSKNLKPLGADIQEIASPDWVDISDNHEKLWLFLCSHNGFDLFDGALIFLPAFQSLSPWPTIEDVYNQFEQLDFLQGQNFVPFAMDVFGFFYLINQEGIYHMETEDGKLAYIAQDINGFLLKLVEDGDYYAGQSFLKAWQKQHEQSLKAGERLAAKKPFIFGGEFEPDNLYNQNLEKIITWYASLYEQLKDVEDGTMIQLQMPQDFS